MFSFLSKDSDVSAADPNDILKNMKVGHYKLCRCLYMVSGPLTVPTVFLCILVQDMDDMDADLFAPKKKPSSAPAQTKPLESNVKPEGAGNSAQCCCINYFLIISFTLLPALKFTLIAAIRESCVCPSSLR